MTWQLALAWVVIATFVIFVVMPLLTYGNEGYLNSVKSGAIVIVFLAAFIGVVLAVFWALHTVGLF